MVCLTEKSERRARVCHLHDMPICTLQTHRELRGLRSTQKSSGSAAYFMITFLGEAQLSVPLRKKNERDRVRKRKVKCMCVCSSEVLADDCHNS